MQQTRLASGLHHLPRSMSPPLAQDGAKNAIVIATRTVIPVPAGKSLTTSIGRGVEGLFRLPPSNPRPLMANLFCVPRTRFPAHRMYVCFVGDAFKSCAVISCSVTSCCHLSRSIQPAASRHWFHFHNFGYLLPFKTTFSIGWSAWAVTSLEPSTPYGHVFLFLCPACLD